jgi:adenylate kinase family enzyme
MPILGPRDALPGRPERVLVGGTSGSGKSTAARVISRRAQLPYTEIDALNRGPGWTVRPEFLGDVEALAAAPRWVTEYLYPDARPVLLARCDLLVYLLLPRPVVMSRVVRRTVRRSVRREVLWNGNVEPPLRTILRDPDHIVRWAWRTHASGSDHVLAAATARPALPLVVLRSGRELAGWLRGPLADALR